MTRIARFFPDNFYDRSFREKLIGRGSHGGWSVRRVFWELRTLVAHTLSGNQQQRTLHRGSPLLPVLSPTYCSHCLLAGYSLVPKCEIYFRLCTCISFFLYFCIFQVCICCLFCLLLPLSGCVYSPHGPPHRVTLTHLATLRLGVCHHQTKSLPGFRFLIQHI